MTMTQFAMVEELAFLIKDNLSCKHLILSTEEALVDFLQHDTSPDGVLELEPMNPYHRLLLHRLADIFGFVHESVGEGDDRHLILERCAESTIPSILVSDILLQYDEYDSPTTSTFILRRKAALPALETRQASFTLPTPVEEREAAYLAARERIFSLNDDDGKKPVASKPRNIPVVARRMIAHALGQKLSLENSREDGHTEELRFSDKKEASLISTSDFDKETTHLSGQKLHSHDSKGHSKTATRRRSSSTTNVSSTQKRVDSQPSRNASTDSSMLQSGSSRRIVGKEDLKKEQLGAAKRMFTHALGLPSGKGNQGLLLKCNEGHKALS